jgi:hypothetical protein
MLKEQILSKSLVSKALDENELLELLKRSLTYLDDASELENAAAEYLDQAYNVGGIVMVCKEVEAGVYDWVAKDGVGLNLHYPDASGKPTLDGITINGALKKADLEIAPSAAARTAAADPSGLYIPLDDDKKIIYDDLEDNLANVFEISTLPKYEKQNNPLLTSNGTIVTWTITHTCKTSQPLIQIFRADGLQNPPLSSLLIVHQSAKKIAIQWDTASNIAANAYYIVLIG